MKHSAALLLLLASSALCQAPPPGVDPDSPMAKYYQGLRSPRGNDCCHEGDCGRPLRSLYFNGSNWIVTTAEGYVVTIVPDIITGPPHPTGQAVFCYGTTSSPAYPINPICFVPPQNQG